jgi:hypothetical protein
MRPTLILVAALVLTPLTLTAHAAPGLHTQFTDVSAAKKKHKKPKAAKEEYLKAAPGTGPSGPQR